jgi:hypothetical protein
MLASPIVHIPTKLIKWDRHTKDHAMYFDGQYVGYRKHRHEAEAYLDQLAYQRAFADGQIAAIRGNFFDDPIIAQS